MRRERGFTLVEILVASAIAAILAAMALTAMNHAMDNRERVREAQQRLVAVQYTVRTLVQDFSQTAPRPERVPVGEGYEPAVEGLRDNFSTVMLTRAGWTNPAGVQRSGLQRVRYLVRDGVLYREYWLTLDGQPQPDPVVRPLLDRVQGFSLRYMNDSRQWQETWRAPQPGNTTDLRYMRWRPLAVEITLQLEDWGTLTRTIEVAG